MQDFREAYAEYHGTELLLFFKECIIKLLKHVLPRKLQGNIRYGFDDPSTTGMVTGFAAVFYPKYEKHFTLVPEFQESCFEASCRGRGRIHLGYFLYLGIRVLLNADVRRIVKKMLG
ncbi:MAG: DUF2953 domain-containing protein [Clostridiales bacterium]|nr:DUF2953 domain-containing protein [Clostridiales bacterium]